jgi:hypothetical protein
MAQSKIAKHPFRAKLAVRMSAIAIKTGAPCLFFHNRMRSRNFNENDRTAALVADRRFCGD